MNFKSEKSGEPLALLAENDHPFGLPQIGLEQRLSESPHASSNTRHQVRVRCFANARRGLAGNTCNVHVGDHAPSGSARSDEVHCHIRPSDSGPHEVSCHIGEQVIRCCGHGLLAAAATLFEMTGRGTTQLAMSGSIMQATRESTSDIIWITFATAEVHGSNDTRLQSKSTAIAALLGLKQEQMIDVALSGGEDGYLLIRVPDGFDLTSISLPGMALANHTRRALIVTSLVDRVGAIGLRYFAPQHGVQEDAATGSAMRILAAYWASWFDELTATQYSPAGGELFSIVSGTNTRIGGRVVAAE